MTRFGVPGFNINPLSYGDIRRPVVPLVQAPRRPTVTDKKFALFTIWRTNKFFSGTEGEIWVLIRYESNGDATWVMISGTGGSITELRADDGNIATPSGGIIDIDGNIVANATNASPLFTRANVANTVDIDLQISTTVTATPGDDTNVGVCCFNENHFTIDPTSGMVSLMGGGMAADQFDIDANTAPGTDPVVPDGSGEVGIFGALVAAHSVPIETHSRAANQFNIEPQIAAAEASSTLASNGMSHYDSSAFTVDADGFVQLVGGGPAMIDFDVQADTAPGTDPVVPDGSGTVQVDGTLVAAQNIPVRTHSTAANQYATELQISEAVASSTLASNGLSHFDSSAFTVDADGFVQLLGGGTPAISFETDDGAPNVVPNGAGEIEIVGGANVTTSGQGPSNVITIDAIIPANKDNFTNIGFDYTSPTFSILSQDGTALSASNKATVTFNSKASPGTQVTIDVTANQSFEDSSGTSDIVNNLFGLFTGDNWGANDIPFFVFAVLNDNEDDVTFMISRMPWMPKSPSSTEIGTPASADADEQYSFFALRSITTTEYDENPVVYIGCFRMRFTQPGGNDDWTVQPLTLEDGPKKNYNNKLFDFPQNVNGAAASSWYRDVGGTAPVFNNGHYKYRIMSDGTYDMRYNNQDLTNSATATGASLTLPYSYGLGTAFGDPAIGTGWVKDGLGAPGWFIFGHPINQQTFAGIMAWNATTLDSDADPATLWTGTGAARLIYLNMSYSVDTNFNN